MEGDGAPGTLESGCYDSYSVLKKNAPFYQGSAPKNQTTENAFCNKADKKSVNGVLHGFPHQVRE